MAKKTPPTGTITVLEAKQKEDHYIQKFYGNINSFMGKNHPNYDGAMRATWFNLEQLKEYIKYVEEHAAEKGYTNLGLRVYFGAEDKMGQDGYVYPRQTVFFVPTAKFAGGTGFEDKNLLGVKRMNFGVGCIPDSVDSDMGVN